MILLGYDARERWSPRARLWPPSRVAAFLLVDVQKPLSVDVFCWPSVFADPQLAVLGLDDLCLGPAGLPAPAWRGPVQDLWQDLSALDRALAGLDSRAHEVIAITTADPWHRPVASATRGSPGIDWTCLGWDVADPCLLSGLMNCGSAAEEHERLREQWGRKLNEHHLFTNERDASAFAQLTSGRVPEHAPFYAYGIWSRTRTRSVGAGRQVA